MAAGQTTCLAVFDDIDRLVLADLALERAFLQTGAIRLYTCKPYWRAALSACWMGEFLGIRDKRKLTHGDAPLQLQVRRATLCYAYHTCG